MRGNTKKNGPERDPGRILETIGEMMRFERSLVRRGGTDCPDMGVIRKMYRMEFNLRQRSRRAAARAARKGTVTPAERRRTARVVAAMCSMEMSLGKRGTSGQRRKLGRKPSRSVRLRREMERMNRVRQRPGRKKLPPLVFRIVECRDGRGIKTVGRYRSVEDAGEAFAALRRKSADVVFPCLTSGIRVRADIHYEYVLIEKCGREQESLRNEYGKYVRQETDVDGWVILDKFRFTPEETFWVWGMDNRRERKTFEWIYENIITAGLSERTEFKRVMVYRNKFLIRDDDGNLDMVICKTDGDAARFYTTLMTYVRKRKMRQILFFGDCDRRAEGPERIEGEIQAMTGWPMKKVKMHSNTFYASSERLLREIEERRNMSESD